MWYGKVVVNIILNVIFNKESPNKEAHKQLIANRK
jgi:hypothetical protein